MPDPAPQPPRIGVNPELINQDPCNLRVRNARLADEGVALLDEQDRDRDDDRHWGLT